MSGPGRRLLLGAMLLAVAGLFSLTPLAAAQSARTIDLAPDPDAGGLGKSGRAVLTDLGNGRTRVQVTLTPGGGDHPAHIHSGECGPGLGGVVYPLNNVRGGGSTTEVNARLSDLEGGSYAVNVHRSALEIQAPYVSCGRLTPGGPLAFLSLDGPTGMGIAAIGGAAVLLGVGYLLGRRRGD